MFFVVVYFLTFWLLVLVKILVVLILVRSLMEDKVAFEKNGWMNE